MKNSNDISVYLNNAVKVIDKWMEYKRFFGRVPGIALGIVYKDKVIFSKGYGYENLKTQKKVTEKTCFRIASISKHFTAIAIMQLVEEGKLQLDDKVQKYLPWFNNSNKDIDKITVRQLLSHTSGITRDGSTFHWIDDNFPTIKEIKEQFAKDILVYSPLERFKYSNFGFSILGEIIHKISGKEYGKFVEQSIIIPLGMKDTYYDLINKSESVLATGYYRDIPDKEREEFKQIKTNGMASATGFISNIVDLCKLVSASFEGNNKLLSDISKREMHRIQWKRKEGESYGLGTEVWTMNDKEIIGHSGGFAGFRTIVSLDKEQMIGVIVLTNTNDVSTDDLVSNIYHILNYFKDHGDDYRLVSKELDDLEGLYSSRWGDLQIIDVAGHLLGFLPDQDKPMKEHYKLQQLFDYEFKIIDTNEFDYPGEIIKFIKDDSGKITKLLLGPIPMDKNIIKFD